MWELYTAMCVPMGELLGLLPSELALIVCAIAVVLAYMCARGGRRVIKAYSVGLSAWHRYSEYADRELAFERSRKAWATMRKDVGQ